jgi:hypothetical protein
VSRVWIEWEHGVSLPAGIECSGSRDWVSARFKKKRREFSSTLLYYLMRRGFFFVFNLGSPDPAPPCLMYLYAFGEGWAGVEAAYRLRNV